MRFSCCFFRYVSQPLMLPQQLAMNMRIPWRAISLRPRRPRLVDIRGIQPTRLVLRTRMYTLGDMFTKDNWRDQCEFAWTWVQLLYYCEFNFMIQILLLIRKLKRFLCTTKPWTCRSMISLRSLRRLTTCYWRPHCSKRYVIMAAGATGLGFLSLL